MAKDAVPTRGMEPVHPPNEDAVKDCTFPCQLCSEFDEFSTTGCEVECLEGMSAKTVTQAAPAA